MSIKRYATACVMALAASAGEAVAQSMDHTALQQLFGEPVTTSAIGTPQRARDVPANMEIVTADDIRRSGEIDIPGVLSHVLGVDVQRWSVLGADVSLRGYNGPMTPGLLVLIDGRQVYVDDFGRAEWSALPVQLAEIRQIEIVKGPNSALFGFNAAGGVINIITFNPLYDRVNSASVRFGTQATREASAVASDKISDTLAVRLSAGLTQSADFQSVRNLAGARGLNRDTSRNQVSIDAHWLPAPGSELELQATHSEDQRFALTPAWYSFYLQNELNSLLVRYIAERDAGAVTLTAYSNWSSADANLGVNPSGAASPAVAVRTQLTVVRLEDVFDASADHTIRLTTEYRHSSYGQAPDNGSSTSYDIASVGGMWNWKVTPTLSLTAAARGDVLWLGRSGGGLQSSTFTNADWSRQIIEPSYNIGAVWHPDEPDRFRATIARGVQLPSLLEFGGVQGVFAALGYLNGNPLMQPTIAQNYEVDWDHDFAAIGATSRVAVFYQTIRNVQSLISPIGVTYLARGVYVGLSGNVGDSDEVGAEFSLKGHFGNGWRWNVGYSPRSVQEKYRSGLGLATTATDFAATTPRSVANASLGWSGGEWEADGFVRYDSSGTGLFVSRAGYGLVPVGQVVSLAGRIGYQAGHGVTVSLSGQNVFVTTAKQAAFGKVEQAVLGTVSVSF